MTSKKILCFTDVHEDKASWDLLAIKAKDKTLDFAICCGDITNFGNDLKKSIKRIADLPLTTFLIHGNHEAEEDVKEEAEKYKNVIFIHKKLAVQHPLGILGWGGGGFSEKDEEFEEHVQDNQEKINNIPALILVTHAPPHNTALDKIESGSHVGNKSFRKFIESNPNVKIALAGHIDENAEMGDKINDCVCINPGPNGHILNVNINDGTESSTTKG
jgi:uncharacterized protein